MAKSNNLQTVFVTMNKIMEKHKNPYSNGNSENPKRLSAILKHLKKSRCSKYIIHLNGRHATREELLLVHTEELIDKILDLSITFADPATKYLSLHTDNYFNESTFDAASFAYGSVLEAAEKIMIEPTNAFSIVRPPGHHAGIEEAVGFCYFNNIAGAAKFLLKNHGIKKILIVDWDIHHGNGTQKIFEDSDQVLYISIHFHKLGFYPYMSDKDDQGKAEFVGVGMGRGYNINIPLPEPTFGDMDYLKIFEEIISPIAQAFAPEVTLVSAGFDGLKSDFTPGAELSPFIFYKLTQFIMSFSPRILMVLEGGYSVDCKSGMQLAVSYCIRALQRENLDYKHETKINLNCMELINQVKSIHSAWWDFTNKCRIYEEPSEQSNETSDNLANSAVVVSSPNYVHEFRHLKVILIKCDAQIAPNNWRHSESQVELDDQSIVTVTSHPQDEQEINYVDSGISLHNESDHTSPRFSLEPASITQPQGPIYSEDSYSLVDLSSCENEIEIDSFEKPLLKLCKGLSDHIYCKMVQVQKFHKIKGKKSCPHCGKTFEYSDNLYRHISSVHKSKQYKCHICNNVLGRSDSLKRHLRLTHNVTLPSSKVTAPLQLYLIDNLSEIKNQYLKEYGKHPDKYNLSKFASRLWNSLDSNKKEEYSSKHHELYIGKVNLQIDSGNVQYSSGQNSEH